MLLYTISNKNKIFLEKQKGSESEKMWNFCTVQESGNVNEPEGLCSINSKTYISATNIGTARLLQPKNFSLSRFMG